MRRHPKPSLTFTNQDLRNRSFKHQLLNGADFCGADLRGCNFQGAQLVGANFTQARMGRTRRQIIVWISLAIATFLIVGHAFSNLVSGSLGQTPNDRAWNYVVALVIALGTAGGLAGLRPWLKPPLHAVVDLLPKVISGAVVGFFYAGVAMGKDPRWAIAGAIIGAGLAAWWSLIQPVTSAISLRVAITLATYGFSFLIGATALSLLNVGQIWVGAGLGLPSLLYLWLTWNGLVDVARMLQQVPGTSFRRAILTDAKFAYPLPGADFSGAVGYLFEQKTNFGDGV